MTSMNFPWPPLEIWTTYSTFSFNLREKKEFNCCQLLLWQSFFFLHFPKVNETIWTTRPFNIHIGQQNEKLYLCWPVCAEIPAEAVRTDCFARCCHSLWHPDILLCWCLSVGICVHGFWVTVGAVGFDKRSLTFMDAHAHALMPRS